MSSEPRQRQSQRQRQPQSIDPELAKARSRLAVVKRWYNHGSRTEQDLAEAYAELEVAQRNAKIRKARQMLQEAGAA